jgi:hypothetical protein
LQKLSFDQLQLSGGDAVGRWLKTAIILAAGLVLGLAAAVLLFTFQPSLKPLCFDGSSNVIEPTARVELAVPSIRPVTLTPLRVNGTPPPTYNETLMQNLYRSRRAAQRNPRPDLACKFL